MELAGRTIAFACFCAAAGRGQDFPSHRGAPGVVTVDDLPLGSNCCPTAERARHADAGVLRKTRSAPWAW
jgi:hypothetical protein